MSVYNSSVNDLLQVNLSSLLFQRAPADLHSHASSQHIRSVVKTLGDFTI